MKLQKIEILEKDNNKKGDLFGRLMGDLFHALGYEEPRLNIHKSGREIDLETKHRTEKKVAIAEFKAQKEKVGGDQINKFVGALEAEKLKKLNHLSKYPGKYDLVGYFISLSGFKETAIEQEMEVNEERVILIKPEKIVEELIAGKIMVPIELAISNVIINHNYTLMDQYDLFAYEKGWVWVLYYSVNKGQSITDFTFVHADGEPLIQELANEIIKLDKQTNIILKGLNYLNAENQPKFYTEQIKQVREKYFNYLANECGEIQFEGIPMDSESSSVKVKLENIFVPLHFTSINDNAEDSPRENINDILKKSNKVAILGKPGAGKSTLIKRIAIAYSFPERRNSVNDNLPSHDWFPIFIRCRELGEKVTSGIIQIINNIANRAEISSLQKDFSILISDVLQKGSALLLIDGLDEISEDKNRVAFVNQLRTFLATYPNVNIVVTSREAGFRLVAGSLANYCKQYIVSSLSANEITDLTLKWHTSIIDSSNKTKEEAAKVSQLILKDYRIRFIASNPLILTTLLFVKRGAGYLPSKITVLYQEMIKLLLVTWNIQGHKQLDIDETEPQLAYVAFWMMKNGQQTIAEPELKICLTNARRQLPEILGYTDISVANFIKQVELRSSLLIMAGHDMHIDIGITPIYEFLHLNIQEYLTAKAIVEKYIPSNISGRSSLEILKMYIDSRSWREVIPLVAVLSKRESKELIEYLIKTIKNKITHDEDINQDIEYYSSLIGSCLANEIQISPELLEESIEWYSKIYDSSFEENNFEIILNSKFGNVFRSRINRFFTDETNDEFITSISDLCAEIYYFGKHNLNKEDLLQSILSEINESTLSTKFMAILGLMNFAYHNKEIQLDDTIKQKLNETFQKILITLKELKKKDLLKYYSISWCLAWCEEARLVPSELRYNFVNFLLQTWFTSKLPNIKRISSWALKELIRPDFELPILKEIPDLEIRLRREYSNTRIINKELIIFLGILIGIKWTEAEIIAAFPKGRSLKELGESTIEFMQKINFDVYKLIEFSKN